MLMRRGCELHVLVCIYSDSAPWLSDLQQIADMATSQYTELRDVCQHLKQQNEALKTLVNQLTCGKGDNTVCDLGMYTKIKVEFACHICCVCTSVIMCCNFHVLYGEMN